MEYTTPFSIQGIRFGSLKVDRYGQIWMKDQVLGKIDQINYLEPWVSLSIISSLYLKGILMEYQNPILDPYNLVISIVIE